MSAMTPFVTDDDLVRAEAEEHSVIVTDSEEAKRRILTAPANQQLVMFLRYAPNLTHQDLESLALDALGRRDTKVYSGGFMAFVDPYLPMVVCSILGAAYAFLHLDQIWMVSCVVWLGYCFAYLIGKQPLALELRMMLAMHVAWVVPLLPTLGWSTLHHVQHLQFDPSLIAVTNTIAMIAMTTYLTKHVHRRH